MCSRVGAGADVDFEGFAAAFEFVGHGDVVAEEAVARHFDAHHSGQHGASVQSDPHLQTPNVQSANKPFHEANRASCEFFALLICQQTHRHKRPDLILHGICM